MAQDEIREPTVRVVMDHLAEFACGDKPSYWGMLDDLAAAKELLGEK